jgi:hypothetical protein
VSAGRVKMRRTLRALSGRRVVIESYGPRTPSFMAISGGGEPPIGAWLSPAALRQLIAAAKEFLK